MTSFNWLEALPKELAMKVAVAAMEPTPTAKLIKQLAQESPWVFEMVTVYYDAGPWLFPEITLPNGERRMMINRGRVLSVLKNVKSTKGR